MFFELLKIDQAVFEIEKYSSVTKVQQIVTIVCRRSIPILGRLFLNEKTEKL